MNKKQIKFLLKLLIGVQSIWMLLFGLSVMVTSGPMWMAIVAVALGLTTFVGITTGKLK